MKYRLAVELHSLLLKDKVSINYISKQLQISYQNAWLLIQTLKALDMLSECKSPLISNISIYTLKKSYDLEYFLNRVNYVRT